MYRQLIRLRQIHRFVFTRYYSLCREAMGEIERSWFFLMTVLYDSSESHREVEQTTGHAILLVRLRLAFFKVRFGFSYTVSRAKSVNSHDRAN